MAEGNLVKLAEADVAFHEVIYQIFRQPQTESGAEQSS